MKKLAAVTMMIAVVAFMAAMASAQHNGWGAIQGTYAMTATGSCLHGSGPFDTTGDVKRPPSGYISTFTGDGLWTFDSEGHGTFQVNQYCITPSPDMRATRTIGPRLPFDYEIASDGEITVTLINKLVLVGRISRDHKTMTLNSVHQEQTGGAGGPTGFQICNVTRVLISVNE